MRKARNEHLFVENLASIPSEEDDDLSPSTRIRPLRSTIVEDDGSTEEEDSMNSQDSTRVNVTIKNKII